MSKSADSSGGPVAIRGFIVQTLIALLDIAQKERNFIELKLEPLDAEDQFDFVWTDGQVQEAVQVKSTKNRFTWSNVQTWAESLEKAATTQKCRLMLVGNCSEKVQKQHGAVIIESRPLDEKQLYEEACGRVTSFIHAHTKQDAGTEYVDFLVEGLIARLLDHSMTREPFSREAFIAYLTRWVTTSPLPKREINIGQIAIRPTNVFIGREVETKILTDAWEHAVTRETGRPLIISFIAFGGEGKTSLVARWLASMAAQHWPGCQSAFAWSFANQGGAEWGAASSDLFLVKALEFFGDPGMANSAEHPSAKGARLAKRVGDMRAVLILDGIEPLQYSSSSPDRSMVGTLKDPGIRAVLTGLASRNHGLCVVTSRYPIRDLNDHVRLNAPMYELESLATEAGVTLLQSLGVRKESGTRAQFETLVIDVKGHALTLNLLGTYLRDFHAGDIRKRDLVRLREADAAEQGGHAFRVIEAYEREFDREGAKGLSALAVLRLLGLFNRPISSDCLDVLLRAPAIPGLTEPLVELTEPQRNFTFTRLADARLLSANRDASGALDSIDCHPLLREHFSEQLRTKFQEAWRMAHKRLYEYLCAATDEGDQPTLEDLQPLYHAVAHGCHAGLQQEVCDELYRDRIQRVSEAYPQNRLGAFGPDLEAITCFFDSPWHKISSRLIAPAQAYLCNAAGYCLRAVGRLSEATDPYRLGQKLRLEEENWKQASINTKNLSELELLKGNINAALIEANRGVELANCTREPELLSKAITALADAQNQAGQFSRAEEHVRVAQKLWLKDKRKFRLLHSLSGFRYCDVVLVAAERAAGSRSLRHECFTPHFAREGSRHRKLCQKVSKRAKQTLSWAKRTNIGDFSQALDHLTIGRAALYMGILERRPLGLGARLLRFFFRYGKSGRSTSLSIAYQELEAAVEKLRRADQNCLLPHALLTRAWLRFLTEAQTGPDSAESDLDEAMDIAARGPMKLIMADIYLYRARLFFRKIVYPWRLESNGKSRCPKDDLDAAKKLIKECGYHRRDAELADAERVILAELQSRKTSEK
ncbi:MAG: hypothetical protein ACKVY0_05020 [Prosthecobacter sp.]|uniref:hypothetical protein n=1 Tax=Prosthecobacter sp. TaxID=1965333 RepID=UPI0039021AF9